MKEKLLLCLAISAIFILIQCNIYHKPRPVAQLTAKISEEIAKKYGIRFCGVGGGGTTKEGEMLVIFEFQRWGNGLTISEGRKLIVNVVNDFLTTFNANKEVRPYLKTYPFTSKNISVGIYCYDYESKIILHPFVKTLGVARGEVSFFTQDPNNRYKLISEIYEPYAEALAIVQNESNEGK